MNWDKVIGHQGLKKQLLDSIDENRVSHAQLFVGQEGYGVLALVLAYAREIFKRENPQSAHKIDHLNHIDLQLCFPVYSEKGKALTERFYTQFREVVLQNPYINLKDWGDFLDSKNKQLFISADEIEAQNHQFSLKSFEGGTKILIIWRADKMNVSASNKFLKFLEEPPEKTLIFLTAKSSEDFLPTIFSRTQVVEVPRLQDEDVQRFITENYTDLEQEKVKEIVFQAQGNINQAMKIIAQDGQVSEYEAFFIQWVRDAFMVMKKPIHLKSIIAWAKDIASWNREKQKGFLDYCTEMFRLAMLQSYGVEQMVYKKLKSGGFKWEAFSKYIHGANIELILEEINRADYHLTRNANAKIVWTDLGIKLSRYIHKKK
ncbi:MAG: DNA polymerase III subunit delta' [Flavobacteriales bacterium]|nr:MAG: DNA polymerase III subunit delta' [Flavobacteriales bacterium]